MDKTFTQKLEDVELSQTNSKTTRELEPSQSSLNLILQFARAYKVCKPEVSNLPVFAMVMN